MKRIAVYCASSSKVDKHYFIHTEQLAAELVKQNMEVVYGGGAVGLMGVLADTIIKHNGKITGVIPHFMNDLEWAHPGLSDLIFVDTMHERKRIMLENTDGIIALPGGSGTLEELLEAITMKRLGLYTKPIVILNSNNYYAPLQEMFEKCIRENFMDEKHRSMWNFIDKPQDVITALNYSSGWSSDAINFAVVK